ncbi:unnamed protein product [Polarella glacialis]|uniref:Uncharacterized protein n=1 Tax=Polarella glacialis TaxID=89957 RepID=A0A813GUU4_POLGL|nr:unnamed protein product [Polarella glacialis]CAE8683068.1 unnamed protein product [Polarella glacialis]
MTSPIRLAAWISLSQLRSSKCDVDIALNEEACNEDEDFDDEGERLQILAEHTPRDQIARQSVAGRLQRQLRMYFDASTLTGGNLAEAEDEFWVWHAEMPLPDRHMAVQIAMDEARQRVQQYLRSASAVMDDIVLKLRSAHAVATRSCCFSAARRIATLLDRCSNAESYDDVRNLNIALFNADCQLYRPHVLAWFAPVVEMFRQVCAEEARLKMNELLLIKLLVRRGLPKEVLLGWLYPASVQEAPQYLEFDAGTTVELEADERWLRSADGTLLYPEDVVQSTVYNEQLRQVLRAAPTRREI